MAYEVTLKKKSIVMKEDNMTILDQLVQSFAANGVGDKSISAGINPNPERKTRKGIINYFKNQAQKFIDSPLGGTYVEISAISVRMDPAAYHLWKQYRSFMIGQLKTIRPSMKMLTKEVVDSRYGLVYHILTRLAALILSNNLDPDLDGEKLINVSKQFCQHVTIETELLKGGVTDDAGKFKNFIHLEYMKWLDKFSIIVEINKRIHAPQDTSDRVCDFLQQLESTLKRHIICNIYPDIDSYKLSDECLETTYESKQRQFLASYTSDSAKRLTSSALTVTDLVQVSAQNQADQLSIVDIVKKQGHNNIAAALKELYSLLNKTHEIIKVASHVETIFSIMAWVAVAAEFIDIKKYVAILSNHWEACRTQLGNPQYMRYLEKNTKAWDSLMAHNSLQPLVDWQTLYTQRFECIERLIDKEVKEYVMSICFNAASQLNSISEYEEFKGLAHFPTSNTWIPYVNHTEAAELSIVSVSQSSSVSEFKHDAPEPLRNRNSDQASSAPPLPKRPSFSISKKLSQSANSTPDRLSHHSQVAVIVRPENITNQSRNTPPSLPPRPSISQTARQASGLSSSETFVIYDSTVHNLVKLKHIDPKSLKIQMHQELYTMLASANRTLNANSSFKKFFCGGNQRFLKHKADYQNVLMHVAYLTDGAIVEDNLLLRKDFTVTQKYHVLNKLLDLAKQISAQSALFEYKFYVRMRNFAHKYRRTYDLFVEIEADFAKIEHKTGWKAYVNFTKQSNEEKGNEPSRLATAPIPIPDQEDLEYDHSNVGSQASQNSHISFGSGSFKL